MTFAFSLFSVLDYKFSFRYPLLSRLVPSYPWRISLITVSSTATYFFIVSLAKVTALLTSLPTPTLLVKRDFCLFSVSVVAQNMVDLN